MPSRASIDFLRNDALETFHRGDAPAAAAKLRGVIDRGGAALVDRLLLADFLWADFRFNEALETYRETLAGVGDTVQVPLLAAKRLFSLGRFDAAATFLEIAAARQPDDPSVIRMLAELRDRQDRLPEAEALSREMLERFPDDVRLVQALAHTLRRSGRLQEAIVLLERQLTEHSGPEDWRLRYELAVCRDRQGDYSAAMQALLAAKEQLRPRAQDHLAQWHANARRRTELARRLDRRTLLRWRNAAGHLPSIPLAWLAGHPRSGTTLIEQILASHSSVVTTDETGVLRGQFIKPLVFDAATTDAAFSELNSFDAGQIQNGRDFYFRATEAHVGEPFAGRLLIEKDPLLTQDLVVPLRLLPEARVLMPLRDPRDVCLSFFFTIVPLHPDSAPALDLITCSASVALSLKLWAYWREILPQSWHEIRYETLIGDPVREIQQLCHFLDLSASEEMLSFHLRSSDRGVRTPTYGDVRQPLYSRAIGRWKNYAQWLEPALGPLEPLLREFSYK
ncbi:MAG: sulfotransferase [Verrucomicrobiales bacterium]